MFLCILDVFDIYSCSWIPQVLFGLANDFFFEVKSFWFLGLVRIGVYGQVGQDGQKETCHSRGNAITKQPTKFSEI